MDRARSGVGLRRARRAAAALVALALLGACSGPPGVSRAAGEWPELLPAQEVDALLLRAAPPGGLKAGSARARAAGAELLDRADALLAAY